MVNGRMITDEESTTQLIHAFTQAADQQAAAQRQVSAVQSELRANWSGKAANTYGTAIGELQAGLTKVQQALSRISDSMVRFASDTSTTEDDNDVAAQLMPAMARSGPIATYSPNSGASWT